MKVSLIIAAGGSGKRFLKGQKGKLPSKLFVDLGGKPILRHTLESFQGIPQIREILLTIPSGTERWVRQHIVKGQIRPRVRLVKGGATRAESVWNALRKASKRSEWVLVHDGARPFPPKETIMKLLQKPPQADGVILARPVVPTLKRVSPETERVVETVDRNFLFEAETPQLVRHSFLVEAYQKNDQAFFATDESSLVESMGGKVVIVPHSEWNAKVTTPRDLELAEAYYVSKQESSVTVGFGRDTHRLVSGRRFYLGGITLPFKKGALGHSDGDALLHAIVDALLGAVGMGDIGDWFPDRSRRTKNMRSEKMVKQVIEAAQKKGWKTERVDTVTILQKPKLGPYKEKIKKKVAGLLGLPLESVSIKAKTQEGLGPEGQGLAVTCEALVLMRRVAS